MNNRLYIANWKSNKTQSEATQFFESIRDNISKLELEGKELVVCPPFTLLYTCRELIDKYSLPIGLGAQNISSFPPGAYTGEINSLQLKGLVEYAIVGHSERRKYFHESDSDIENKVREAMEANIKVIECIQDENSVIHKDVQIVAYEPPSAIGSGNPDEPEHIKQVFDKVKQDNKDLKLIYGGSVNPENISSFLAIENLSGFLVGGASLEASSFLSLLNG